MINILLGAPGGGKSYEAVVYQILPALARGRKVITNLPLNVEQLGLIDDSYPALVELRTQTLAKPPEVIEGEGEGSGGVLALVRQARATRFVNRPFANIEDFQTDWRGEDGTGPLFVIDECHFVMPRGGTARAIEEWFSMHRHYNVDVLLITQSAGKISTAIKDLVQVCYKVRKATALGDSDSYIRKVFDGVNGGETSTAIRKYKPQFFKLYRSHTQGMAVAELKADDVAPLVVKFRRFARVFYVVTALVLVYAFWPHDKPAKKMPADIQARIDRGVAEYKREKAQEGGKSGAVGDLPAGEAVSAVPEPYASKGLHLTGRMSMGKRVLYSFSVSDSGRRIADLTSDDLVRAGYVWEPLTDCAGTLRWHGKAQAITCDAPAVPAGTRQDPVVVGLPAGAAPASSVGAPRLSSM